MDSENTLLALEKQIEGLEEERAKLEIQELYSEADNVARKLASLKGKLKQKQLGVLSSSHSNERLILEENYQAEMKGFNNNWDNIIEAYLSKCKNELDDFNKKHQQDILFEKERLEGTLHMFFKPSGALLNMIKCKEKAVKVGKYAEAQILLDQIEEARAFEENRFAEQKKAAVDQGLCNFEINYDKKLINLKKRHQTGLDELEIQRVQENDIINKKYDNLRREMENTQQIMKNIHEGKHTTAAGRHHQSPNKTFFSTSSSSPSTTRKVKDS